MYLALYLFDTKANVHTETLVTLNLGVNGKNRGLKKAVKCRQENEVTFTL